MSKFKYYIQQTLLLILIYSYVAVLYVRSLFHQRKTKERAMPEQITAEMLHEFHHAAGEDIFEYAPDAYHHAFGDFLIQQYPQFKNEIKAALHSGGDYFEYHDIDQSFTDVVANAYNATVIDLEFIKFCNTNDECRREVLEIMTSMTDSE